MAETLVIPMAAAAADNLDERLLLRLLYGTSLPHNDGIRKLFLGCVPVLSAQALVCCEDSLVAVTQQCCRILNVESAASSGDDAAALKAAKAALMQLETLRFHVHFAAFVLPQGHLLLSSCSITSPCRPGRLCRHAR